MHGPSRVMKNRQLFSSSKIIQIIKRSRTGRFKSIVAIGYEVLVNIELGVERALDYFFSKPVRDPRLDDVTALIKTFERPKKLKGLVKSIKRMYPKLKIIVVDDSESPTPLDGVEAITLPYDSGVSAGRNVGLAAIQTKYMICLDDDFVFNRHTDLLGVYQSLEKNPDIDILAGEVIYLPLRIIHDYAQIPVFHTGNEPVVPFGSKIGGFRVHAKVPNFYMGRTEKIRLVGWDDNLKRVDHADFFTRAVGVLVAVQNRRFKVLHYPTYFNKKYMDKKNDLHRDSVILAHKYRRKGI